MASSRHYMQSGYDSASDEMSIRFVQGSDEDEDYFLPRWGRAQKHFLDEETVRQRQLEFNNWWKSVLELRRRVRKKRIPPNDGLNLAERILLQRRLKQQTEQQVAAGYGNSKRNQQASDNYGTSMVSGRYESSRESSASSYKSFDDSPVPNPRGRGRATISNKREYNTERRDQSASSYESAQSTIASNSPYNDQKYKKRTQVETVKEMHRHKRSRSNEQYEENNRRDTTKYVDHRTSSKYNKFSDEDSDYVEEMKYSKNRSQSNIKKRNTTLVARKNTDIYEDTEEDESESSEEEEPRVKERVENKHLKIRRQTNEQVSRTPPVVKKNSEVYEERRSHSASETNKKEHVEDRSKKEKKSKKHTKVKEAFVEQAPERTDTMFLDKEYTEASIIFESSNTKKKNQKKKKDKKEKERQTERENVTTETKQKYKHENNNNDQIKAIHDLDVQCSNPNVESKEKKSEKANKKKHKDKKVEKKKSTPTFNEESESEISNIDSSEIVDLQMAPAVPSKSRNEKTKKKKKSKNNENKVSAAIKEDSESSDSNEPADIQITVPDVQKSDKKKKKTKSNTGAEVQASISNTKETMSAAAKTPENNEDSKSKRKGKSKSPEMENGTKKATKSDSKKESPSPSTVSEKTQTHKATKEKSDTASSIPEPEVENSPLFTKRVVSEDPERAAYIRAMENKVNRHLQTIINPNERTKVNKDSDDKKIGKRKQRELNKEIEEFLAS